MPTALNPRHLKRTMSVQIAGQRQIQWFQTATLATVTEVQAAGWFNPARDSLTKDSIVEIVADISGTPARLVLRIATLPASPSDVTVVVDGGLVAT